MRAVAHVDRVRHLVFAASAEIVSWFSPGRKLSLEAGQLDRVHLVGAERLRAEHVVAVLDDQFARGQLAAIDLGVLDERLERQDRGLRRAEAAVARAVA